MHRGIIRASCIVVRSEDRTCQRGSATDPPAHPVSPRTTGNQAYLRLHGRNEKGWLLNTFDGRYDYLYNNREMQEIRRRVFALPQNCSRAFILWNNTTNGKAVANALQCMAVLKSNGAISAPPEALQAFPWLRDSPVHLQEIHRCLEGEYREAM